jgi:NADH-quinone oxidoreductase subunit H
MAMYSTLAERKIAAWLQDRMDLTEQVKVDFTTTSRWFKIIRKKNLNQNPKQILFYTGPAIAMSTALMTSAVIPWEINFIFWQDIILQVSDIDNALLYILLFYQLVYGIMIGGWASNNKFSLMGAVRAASQMVSYEVAMGLSIIAY